MLRKALNKMAICFVAGVVGVIMSSSVSAATLSVNFTDPDVDEITTLVWNHALGLVHAPLQINSFKRTFVSTPEHRSMDVGDGRHGAFTPSTYVNFSQGGDISGNIIRIDTDEYTSLQFTNFSLAAGWTIRPEGSNPLVIKSLTYIAVNGTIDCSGDNGDNFSGSPTVATSGGSGRCGGGDGGSGGYVTPGFVTIAATNGSLGGELIPDGVTTGVPGPTVGKAGTGSASGGGGGGSYTEPLQGVGVDAEDGTGATAGQKGDQVPDHAYEYIGGGFGGGGGSSYDGGAAAQNSAGGGGGGGGGVIDMAAVGEIIVYSTGLVLANGGAGGGSGAVILAGGGGGGGGGTIVMFAGGEVFLAGSVTANRGAASGGVNIGGGGAVGRTWLAGLSGFSQALPPDPLVPEQPATFLNDVGFGRYQIGTFTLVSQAFDSQSSKPDVMSVSFGSTVVGGGSVTAQISSGETASFSPTQWIGSASFSGVQSRFFRFQIVIDNQNGTTPSTAHSLSVQYVPFRETQFNFTGGCARVQDIETPSDRSLWVLLALMLSPVLLGIGLRLSLTQSR